MELKVIPIVQVIIAMILMGIISKFLPQFHYNLFYRFAIITVIIIIALTIGFLAVYSFKRHQTTVNPSKPESSSKVVNSGVYQFSRNPMYLAMLLALIGYAFYLENVLNFVICAVFFWYINKYQILPEEQMLTQLFGAEYLQYQQQVRRWI